jgi:hypothetical protein
MIAFTDKKLTDIESVSFSKEGYIRKSPTIWARIGCVITPLCYLRKPKHVSDTLWNDFLRGFTFTIKYPPSVETESKSY